MTISNGYSTLAKFQTLFNVPVARVAPDPYATADAARDVEIEATIEAASRSIDLYTHRIFYTSTNDETRYYTAEGGYKFECPDDIISVTSVATEIDGSYTYAMVWTANDFDLLPYNAVADGVPYTEIDARILQTIRVFFTSWPRGVKIVGKFGDTGFAHLGIVQRACALQSYRDWMRKASPGSGGVAPKGTTAYASGLDPDIERMLNSVRRL